MKIGFLKFALIVIFLAFPIYADAQGERTTIHTFGNWRIDQVFANNSYLMTGLGDVTDLQEKFVGYRYIAIQCYKGHPDKVYLVIPIGIYPEYENELKESNPVMMWSDSNPPTKLVFHVYERTVFHATIDQAYIVVNMLKNSKERFSFSFLGKSVEINTKDFIPAWTTLQNLCEE